MEGWTPFSLYLSLLIRTRLIRSMDTRPPAFLPSFLGTGGRWTTETRVALSGGQ